MDIIKDIKGSVVTVTDFHGKEKSFEIVDIFGINESDLNNEYATQASAFAYFSSLLAAEDYKLSQAKALREREYAAADIDIREELAELGEKATEGKVKSMVELDEVYQECIDSENKARYRLGLLKSIVSAMRMRADMLVSLGANLRQEYDMTGMHLNAKMDKAVDNVKDTIKKRRQSS